MKHVDAFSDGSARGNPGPGGWGAVMRYTDADGGIHTAEGSQGYRRTTNNRMEILGALWCLETLTEPCVVVMTTDSQYVVNAVEKGWARGWAKAGWIKHDGKPAKNRDLWERMLTQLDRHRVRFRWVKGHNGHPENERCDRLATSAADDPASRIDDVGFDG